MVFLIKLGLELLLLPVLLVYAGICRLLPKKVDVGLGPEPLINNVYHKKAMERLGYRCETFVFTVYYITSEFDVRIDRLIPSSYFAQMASLFWILPRYRCLMVYFHGVFQDSVFYWKLEPRIFRLAGVKTVVLPYGSDVQVMTRSPNLYFKHAMSLDYPGHRGRRARLSHKVDLWTVGADRVFSGCEWVDYMYFWHTLMLGHFSIDTALFQAEKIPVPVFSAQRPMKVFHAPNHRNMKGTRHLQNAVVRLKEKGLHVELVLAERVPNERIKELIRESDLILDQLVIGWYAMFALEAMSSGKPVVCYLREDLKELYLASGVLSSEAEIPIINASFRSLESVLENLYRNPQKLVEAGEAGPSFVMKYHSLEAVGAIFEREFLKPWFRPC